MSILNVNEGRETEMQPFFRFRVLIEFDRAYNVVVAHCLETGHVVTADDPAMALEMITELLQDEVIFAVEHQNFPNLFSTPSSADVWVRWANAVRKKPPKRSTLVFHAEQLRLDEPEVSTEVAVAFTKEFS